MAALEATAGRCARDDCDRPAVEVHHVLGVAADPTHQVLEPLCSAHHAAETGRQRRAPRSRPATVVATSAIGRRRRVRLGPLDP
jgi:hypothetical protein